MNKFFLLSFLLFSYFVHGQQYNFKAFTTKDGLPNNYTFDILQASDHRIWVATLGGVSCFNGSSFTNYTKDDGLASNLVLEVFEDSKGRIWVGTVDNGISIIDKGKVWTPKEIDYFPFGAVNEFLETSDGTIYIFANKAVISYKDDIFTVLNAAHPEENHFFTMSVAQYDENTFYIASSKGGIIKLTLSPFKKEIINNEENKINSICYSVSIDDVKNIWVGSYGVLYKLKNDTVTEYVPDWSNFDVNRIWSIHQDKGDTMVLGTEGNGFMYFDKRKGTFEIINKSNGLPSNYMYQLIQDKEQNYWMATYGEGIVKFKDKAFKYYTENDLLPTNEVYDVVEWNGQKVLATDKGLLFLKDEKIIQTLFKDVEVLRLRLSQQNELIIITGGEAYILEKDKKPRLWDKGHFFDVYKDSTTSFLVGNGLKVVEKDTTYRIRFRRSFKTVPIGDRYLFGKLYGLFQFKDGKLDTIPGIHPSKYKVWRGLDAISESEAFAVNKDYLFYIRLRDTTFEKKIFPLKRFLTIKNVEAIKVQNDNLWLKSENAYNRLDIKLLLEDDSISIKTYKENTDFIFNSENRSAVTFDTHKNILTATDRGLFVFDESEYTNTKLAPYLDLNEVQLFSETLPDSLYRKENNLVLPYDQNYLTFTMEAITYTYPENVYYKYRLKGLRANDEWSTPTQKTEAIFSYLPPGDYVFEFTADNGNGVWQESIYTYPFQIKTPFWRTSIFWIGLILSLAILSILILYIRNKNVQKRQQKFSQDLINAQENERQRISRELHDSIGQKLLLIKNMLFKQQTNPDTVLVDKTIEEVRGMSQSLHPFQFEKLGLIASIKNLVTTFQKNSEIFYSEDIEEIDLHFKVEKSIFVYRMIQECLQNVEKHSKAKACRVNVEKKGNRVIFEVKDNGIGFDVSKASDKLDSLGMKTLYERAQVINAKLSIQSTKEKGTTIQIHLS